MSCIHFVGGEKGGVGKSVFARLLCQWFVDHSAKFSALDADLVQGALMSGYAGSCQAVDLSVFESADQIMDRALGAPRDVVVDLPANSLDQLSRWLRESDVIALAEEMGVRLVFWLVTDGSVASLATLEKTLSQLAASAEVVLVRNQCWARDFSELEATELGRQLAERGGRAVDLPALDPSLMSKWESGREGLAGLTLRESPSGERALSPMERQRMARWLALGYAAVESIVRPIAVEVVEPSEDQSAAESAESQAATAPGESQAATESSDGPAATESVSVELEADGERIDGARTWSEKGRGYQIYHVRY